jgi:aminoglycoside 2''-phosphotransferase
VGLTHSASTWEAYLPRIRQIAPGLVIETVTLNADGMANEVVIVNGEVAFRFAKGEFGVQSLRRELQALAALPAGLAVAIPQPFYTGEDVMAYRFLPGEALTRHRLLGLPPARQQTIASQLGEFLQVMHAMQDPALSATAAPVDVERFRSQHERARQVVYPLLLPHQVAWAEQVYGFLDQPEAFEYTPALIHGDLAPYHILYDPDRQRLSGVIDFGVAGLGDPASDWGGLLVSYGGGFVRRMLKGYPQVQGWLPRARFYAQAIEMQWVLLGLEQGENFWFTAHLGGARDDRIP